MDENPRMTCGCPKARKYRKILAALDSQSEDAAPMPVIDPVILEDLRIFADLICRGMVDGVTVKLGDGTTVAMGGKVSRTARLKLEEKVDE